MLIKSHISDIEMLAGDGSKNPDWTNIRLAKFTSSQASRLIEDRSFDTYVEEKVGEELSGIPADEDVDTDSTRHGNMYEIDGLKTFCREQGHDFIIVQKLIHNPDTRFSSTPDGLIVLSERKDHPAYNVEPVEVKCPMKGHRYIKLFQCNNALDLKRVEKKYYWQVLDQIDNTGALRGWFIAFHPYFKAGNRRIIEFRLMEEFDVKGGKKRRLLNDDLILLQQRKKLAIQRFNTLRNSLLGLQDSKED